MLFMHVANCELLSSAWFTIGDVRISSGRVWIIDATISALSMNYEETYLLICS